MRIYLASVLGLFVYSGAQANCIYRQDKISRVKFDEINAPLYDARGIAVPGCLLHGRGKVLGYAREDRLCSSRTGKTVKVRLSYGCCDTGPDQGDLECIVRTKPSSGASPAHGNGVVVHSADGP